MKNESYSTMLASIIKDRANENCREKKTIPLEDLKYIISRMPPPRPFAENLRRENNISLIAEIKKQSPSRGTIKPGANAADLAEIYTRAGAAAISVLANRKYFGGSPEDVNTARNNTHLPVLYKEFIIDPYQLYRARACGADAVLLIARLLSTGKMKYLMDVASDLDMEVLAETHDRGEIERALEAGAKIIGINNRNLNTFTTDLNTTLSLRRYIKNPGITVVSESGIRTRRDMEKLETHGIHAALVGETIMQSSDPFYAAQELLGKSGKDNGIHVLSQE